MVIELERSKEGEQAEPEMVTLFKLDGKEYGIPAKPKPVIALRYLNDVRKSGQDVAAANILATLLGEEAWETLVGYDDLTGEQFQSILATVHEILAGSMEGPAQKDFTKGR